MDNINKFHVPFFLLMMKSCMVEAKLVGRQNNRFTEVKTSVVVMTDITNLIILNRNPKLPPCLAISDSMVISQWDHPTATVVMMHFSHCILKCYTSHIILFKSSTFKVRYKITHNVMYSLCSRSYIYVNVTPLLCWYSSHAGMFDKSRPHAGNHQMSLLFTCRYLHQYLQFIG